MSNNIKLYTVLTYILIPFALFIGFIDTILVLVSILNPSGLLYAFVLACFVIYTFTSFKFFRLGVQREQTLKKNLKDWVKVNAIVSIFLCSLLCLNGLSIVFSSNATLTKYIDEIIAQQPGFPTEITTQTIIKILKGISIFFLIMGTVGLVHIRQTFRYLKQYGYLFEEVI